MALLAKIKALFGSTQRVVRSQHLNELLWAVQQDRVPVQVRLSSLGRDDQVFNSYVLDVKPGGGSDALEIDELVPREGNDIAQKLGKLTVMIDHQGTQAHFTVSINKFDGTFHTAYPSVIHIDQQRSTKRMRLTDLGSFPVEIYSDGRNMVRATLTDVSLGGLQLRVRMNERITSPFRQGEIIHGIHLNLSKSAHVQLHVELRSVVLKRSQRNILLGAKIRGFKDKKDEVTFKDWVRVVNDRMNN